MRQPGPKQYIQHRWEYTSAPNVLANQHRNLVAWMVDIGVCTFKPPLLHVNVNFPPCLTKYHTMNRYPLRNLEPRHENVLQNGDITPHILNLSTRSRSVDRSFTPRPLYPRGSNPRYPLNRRLGGPQDRSGRGGEKKIPAPAGNRTPVVQPIA
jgi:hypothetical protein